ncbi:transposase [Erysipelothrix inopinata]|uniref:Mutator family transposase n=1 Tax=Erysipelothrix inopinata TaxID=225084 RepID=A0A7G9RYS8_9FIRM|nr:transposase [Erysipelothrix inopinata]
MLILHVKQKNEIIDKYSELYPKMTECPVEGFEDEFQYCAIEEINYPRLKSTNMLERLNSEIRRRDKLVRMFTNEASVMRLISSILIDISEKWESSLRQYIKYTDETKKWID